MFLVGMQMAETGAALQRIANDLLLEPSREGLLVSVRFVGGIAVGLALWMGIKRVRTKRMFVTALLLVTLSGPLLAVERYESVLLVAILRGLSVGAIIPLSGIYASAQMRWSAGFVAAVVNAAVSAGLIVLSALALAMSTAAGIPWQLYWAIPSALGAILLLLLPLTRLPDTTTEESAELEPEADADPEHEGKPAAEGANDVASELGTSRSGMERLRLIAADCRAGSGAIHGKCLSRTCRAHLRA